MRKLVPVRVYLLALFEVMLAAASYVAAMYLIRPIDAGTYLELEGGSLRVAVMCLTVSVALYLFDAQRQSPAGSRLLLALQLCQVMGIVLLVQATFAFAGSDLTLPQSIVLTGSLFLLVALVGWRVFVRPAVWASFGAQKVLFVGWSQTTGQLAEIFRNEPLRGMEVAGFVDCGDPGVPVGGPVLGPAENLHQIVYDVAPDRIIVEGGSAYKSLVVRELLNMTASGAEVQTSGRAYEAEFARVDCLSLHPYTVVFLESAMARPGSVALQAVYTNIIALVALVVLLPILLVIAVAKKISGGGTILATYRCTGLHGIPFTIYQFRCSPNSRHLVDRFLRRFKLVGLPQILNLVRGEVALLGPRPERCEVDDVVSSLIPFYRLKQSVKPGLYGWSQLHCDPMPQEDTLRRLEYDLYYIRHMSVALDIYIVLRAFRWILSGKRYTPDTRYAGDTLQAA